jgi:hypothetical protein
MPATKVSSFKLAWLIPAFAASIVFARLQIKNSHCIFIETEHNMKNLIAIFMLALLPFAVYAQSTNFKGKQKQQIKDIKAAFKAKKITENEYNKLMDEQETIKSTIEKYELDDYLDSHEKNTIYDKQERAKDRLRRYKTNSERF